MLVYNLRTNMIWFYIMDEKKNVDENNQSRQAYRPEPDVPNSDADQQVGSCARCH